MEKKNYWRRGSLWILSVFLLGTSQAQESLSRTWVSDQGDGTYINPVLHADYSDPDAIRVGDDYYLTASSFEDIPGLPILHSKDLVNWRLIGHALPRLDPAAHFAVPRHGCGVWAPSLRYHKGEFYLYYPDPDFGIFLLKAKKVEGPWSAPVLVAAGKGLIDPCPLWDDDGQAYLVHAYAGSRAGIKSVLVLRRLSPDGTRTLDEGVLVYDGHATDPTIEGPKLYKREGWYYIFAPAGGVSTGWQLVLRSKNIYGPYERKVVMGQGSTPINGPHQGAWVRTQGGEDWFLHFQDKEAYGRVLHLQPMRWNSGWPVIGVDSAGSGKGVPVLRFRKPNVGRNWPKATPPESDEFNSTRIGRQWQWPANSKATWAFADAASGVLRLFSDVLPDSARNLWGAANVLQQKFPAESFTATTQVTFHPNAKLQERAGLSVMGLAYAGLALQRDSIGLRLLGLHCPDADKGGAEQSTVLATGLPANVYLRVTVAAGARCRFSWSTDGTHFTEWPQLFVAQPGRWKGAKLGLFCVRPSSTNDAGYLDVDWFRLESL
ncbi:glycoside hydrolase family 43 protein [Flaviaesturariibacter aridisoli]|uniref:Glycosyl hydrolase 43 family protein n=1 Tax=Flaviaesturariibacter aridisoli TaxID=2545761 RepID=A0A4R4E3M2_9BACT|nr:glycoside hydrolase 43 family protein [Flaviaesturariibacter aridisoli]TCZ73433.1 glycosyl hydrolase 43 family protein [Flaviaesturariibacter aridisoli]